MTTEYTPVSGLQAHQDVQPALLRRISWGAIFAGTIIALAVMILLSLLGLAIGFGVVDPTEGETPGAGFAVGSGVWAGISSIIAVFAGSFVAGRLAGLPLKPASMLHGATVWAAMTLVMMYIATTAAGGILGGATSAVAQAGSAVASAAGSAASGIGGAVAQAVPDQMPAEVQQALRRRDLTVQDVRQEVRQVLAQAGLNRQDLREATAAGETLVQDLATSPGDAGADIQAFIDKLTGGPDAVISDEERQQVIDTLQARTGLSDAEVERIVQTAEQRLAAVQEEVSQALDEAEQMAIQATERALNALTSAALVAFIASLIGLAAACFGGIAGAPKDLPARRVS